MGAVAPQVEGGLYPAKRVVGDRVEVTCDLVCDGHDAVAGVLLYRQSTPVETAWQTESLRPLGNDRFGASLSPGEPGVWEFAVEAWVDTFTTWRLGTGKKLAAAQDVRSELVAGSLLLRAGAARASGRARPGMRRRSSRRPQLWRTRRGPRPSASPWRRARRPSRPPVDTPIGATRRAPLRTGWSSIPRGLASAPGTRCSPGPRGRRGSTARSATACVASPTWPRWASTSSTCRPSTRSGGPSARAPTTRSKRARPTSGVPGPSGRATGATRPCIETSERSTTSAPSCAKRSPLGIDVAIDIALQASPDHPYVTQHPEWFVRRPDGSIQYAENPPKKYQDVYPFDFECEAWESLWQELASIFFFWREQGIRVFRVDNPHTKPIAFWEWCIGQVKARYPEVIFLAEAFTRPKLMYALAEGGIHAVVHLFRLAPVEVGVHRIHARADPAPRRRLLPTQLLAEHARHLAREPAVRRACGVRAAPDPRRDPLEQLRDLRASLRAHGERRPAGHRGVRR